MVEGGGQHDDEYAGVDHRQPTEELHGVDLVPRQETVGVIHGQASGHRCIVEVATAHERQDVDTRLLDHVARSLMCLASRRDERHLLDARTDGLKA
eukprot:12454681-Alexandrium_andersonii.AAC.2